VEVLINGEVRKAEFFKEYVQYEAAKNFCEESKSFLPKQPFRILQPSFLQEKIFWLAENEVSRNQLVEKRRDLIIYMPTNDAREYCAMSFISENDTDYGASYFYLFLCVADLRDAAGRFILFKNSTIDCDPFIIKREHLVQKSIGSRVGLNKTFVCRDLVDNKITGKFSFFFFSFFQRF